MKDERVNSRAKLRDQERHAVSHQARDKMHVARQPIQLGHGHRTTLTAGLAEGCCKLWPAVQCVNAFACLNLDKHAKKVKAFRGREARESFLLRL